MAQGTSRWADWPDAANPLWIMWQQPGSGDWYSFCLQDELTPELSLFKERVDLEVLLLSEANDSVDRYQFTDRAAKLIVDVTSFSAKTREAAQRHLDEVPATIRKLSPEQLAQVYGKPNGGGAA